MNALCLLLLMFCHSTHAVHERGIMPENIYKRLDRIEKWIGMVSGKNKVLTIHGRERVDMSSDKRLAFFRKMDRMVGYLWCIINGRLTVLQTSGTEVANIFAELKRRCGARNGTILSFAIKLNDL
jgi:hypothetical protein